MTDEIRTETERRRSVEDVWLPALRLSVLSVVAAGQANLLLGLWFGSLSTFTTLACLWVSWYSVSVVCPKALKTKRNLVSAAILGPIHLIVTNRLDEDHADQEGFVPNPFRNALDYSSYRELFEQLFWKLKREASFLQRAREVIPPRTFVLFPGVAVLFPAIDICAASMTFRLMAVLLWVTAASFTITLHGNFLLECNKPYLEAIGFELMRAVALIQVCATNPYIFADGVPFYLVAGFTAVLIAAWVVGWFFQLWEDRKANRRWMHDIGGFAVLALMIGSFTVPLSAVGVLLPTMLSLRFSLPVRNDRMRSLSLLMEFIRSAPTWLETRHRLVFLIDIITVGKETDIATVSNPQAERKNKSTVVPTALHIAVLFSWLTRFETSSMLWFGALFAVGAVNAALPLVVLVVYWSRMDAVTSAHLLLYAGVLMGWLWCSAVDYFIAISVQLNVEWFFTKHHEVVITMHWLEAYFLPRNNAEILQSKLVACRGYHPSDDVRLLPHDVLGRLGEFLPSVGAAGGVDLRKLRPEELELIKSPDRW